MEMIERVRDAINKADVEWEKMIWPRDIMAGLPDDMPPKDWFIARAAIEAMREPTEKMKEAAGVEFATDGIGGVSPWYANYIWGCMIEESLKEPKMAKHGPKHKPRPKPKPKPK